jgi:putative transposase
MQNPLRYFNSSPEVIVLVVMMYIRYPLSLRQVKDLLFERGIYICHETVRFRWNRFAPQLEPVTLVPFKERCQIRSELIK